MKEAKIKPAGWILYDDSCGFCRRWVPFWAKTLRKRGFEIAPLQADWVSRMLKKPCFGKLTIDFVGVFA